MRAELKDFQYHCYGLSESDLDYIFELVLRVQQSHARVGEQGVEKLRDDPEAVEIVSDDLYYSYLDTVFLWEYCLWRLQAVFEGLITDDFLGNSESKDERRGGLHGRLTRMREAGYSLSAAEEEELQDWASRSL